MSTLRWASGLLASSRVLHAALLALPFIVVAVATGGLSRPFAVYQAYDELEHLSVIATQWNQWPRPLLGGYGTWSGPLVYWLLTAVGRGSGGSLQAMRLGVSVMSWATCLTAYVIFRDRLGARPELALAWAGMLALSPFFFGASFYVLTDNPTWLLVTLALERLLAWTARPRCLRLVAFSLAAAAATVMRQVSVWVFVAGGSAVLSVPGSRRARVGRWAIVVAGLVPLAALLLHWGALLPQGVSQTEPATVRLRNVLLGVAVIGLWSLLLAPADEVRALPRRLGRRGWAAVGCATALGLAAVGAGGVGDLAVTDPLGIGLLGRLCEIWPAVAGASLAWWVLVPLGAAALAALAVTRRERVGDRVLVVGLAALALVGAGNTMWFQRYADYPVMLILLALVASAGRSPRTVDVARWVVVVAVSLLWTLSRAIH